MPKLRSQNLTKPPIQIYLNEHIDKAKNRVVQLIDSQKDDIALRASDSVLNRALGMPTQRQESVSTTVSLSLTLKDVVDQDPV